MRTLTLIAASLALTLAGCGYGASPIDFTLNLTAAGGAQDLLVPRGIADPAASAHADGMMMSTRWRVESGGDTVQLMIDINRETMPTEVEPGMPVDIPASRSRVRLQIRTAAELTAELTPDTHSLQVTGWRLSDNAELSQGDFGFTFPAGAPYETIAGSWVTVPSPTTARRGDTRLPGGDAAPTPGDSGSSGAVQFGNTASCACIPEDDGPEPPPIDTGSTEIEDAPSCDCEGDSFDTGSSDAGCDGGGCDGCEGDPLPSAGVGETRTRGHVCRPKSALRVAVEWSPIFFVWVIAWFRRRPRYWSG